MTESLQKLKEVDDELVFKKSYASKSLSIISKIMLYIYITVGLIIMAISERKGIIYAILIFIGGYLIRLSFRIVEELLDNTAKTNILLKQLINESNKDKVK